MSSSGDILSSYVAEEYVNLSCGMGPSGKTLLASRLQKKKKAGKKLDLVERKICVQVDTLHESKQRPPLSVRPADQCHHILAGDCLALGLSRRNGCLALRREDIVTVSAAHVA